MSSLADELAALTTEYNRLNPDNTLKFCADYFNARLLDSTLNSPANSSGQKGDTLQGIPPSFKHPFDSNDPHAAHPTDPHAHSHSHPDASSTGPFKSSFAGSLVPAHPNPAAFNANRRTSVSAEAMNPDKFNLDSWVPPTNNLSEEQRELLSKVLASNFLFRLLEPNLQKTVLSALQKQSFTKGANIITQGDVGDFFYIIEDGSVQFIVGGVPLQSAGPGASFGELALMYNSPRAATVLALSDVTCWLLDRATFRRILVEGTFKRRIMYENFLKDVEILSSLLSHERSKIADALSTEMYSKGDKIVSEGEKGENFFFIERGNCDVYTKAGGHIKVLRKGDYFGEIALLNDLPRQATVEAIDSVVVATLGKSGFQRLLGPAVDVLKKRDPSRTQ